MISACAECVGRPSEAGFDDAATAFALRISCLVGGSSLEGAQRSGDTESTGNLKRRFFGRAHSSNNARLRGRPRSLGTPKSGRWASAGSEVAHQGNSMLTIVRRSNVVCGFPAPRFHEDSLFCDAIEGISFTSCTSPYSPYSLRFGSCFQPQLRQHLYRCDQMRRSIHRSSLLKSVRTWARL